MAFERRIVHFRCFWQGQTLRRRRRRRGGNGRFAMGHGMGGCRLWCRAQNVIVLHPFSFGQHQSGRFGHCCILRHKTADRTQHIFKVSVLFNAVSHRKFPLLLSNV